MIKFFRRIRQTFLAQGKIKGYLLYGLGEIFLVVIGILIALQINNWNQGRKQTLLEHSTLLELKSSLITDIEKFKRTIKANTANNEVGKYLLNHITKKRPYDQALDTMWVKTVRYNLVNLDNAGFNLLQSRGSDLISSEQLRKAIIDYYINNQATLEDQIDTNRLFSDRYINYMFEHLYNPITDNFEEEFDVVNESLLPIDYNGWIQDSILIVNLSNTIKRKHRMNLLTKIHLEKAEALFSKIEIELTEKFSN